MEFVGTFYLDGTCDIAMWDVDEDFDGSAATDTDKDDSQDSRPDLRGGKGVEHSCFLDTFADDINEYDDIEEEDNKDSCPVAAAGEEHSWLLDISGANIGVKG